MMNQNREVLIIGRDFHPDGKETAAFIAESLLPVLATRNIGVTFVPLKNLVFDISNQKIRVFDALTGRDLDTFQAVLMTNWFSHASIRKDMAYTLAQYFERGKIPFFNSESLHSRSTSKLSQMMLAALSGVPVPRTVFSLSLEHTKAYMVAENFPQPFIFKDAQASRGKGNYLLHQSSDIDTHASEHSEIHPFVVQELIASDGADYRFFVAGGKTRLVIKRIGNGASHLNNTSAGASTEIVPLTEFSNTTVQGVDLMSKLLHREVTGIDMMIDQHTEQPYFLEANPIPQIATGSNIELKLAALADALQESIEGEKS